MIEYNGRVLFADWELRCKGSGLLILAPGFADRLRVLRVAFNRPMNVSSACRSREHNHNVGGHPRSLHVCDEPHWPTGGCCAVDVRTHALDGKPLPDGYRERLEHLAWYSGWSVGYGSTFLHLDRRIDYTRLRQARFDY